MGSTRGLHGLLEGSSDRFADRVAVEDAEGLTLSYAGLERRAQRMAGRLRNAGVGSGDRVGILLPKSLGSVVGLFGAMKAGAAYVPLDAGAPPERNAYIADDCRMTAILTDPERLEALQQVLPANVIESTTDLGSEVELDQALKLLSLRWPEARQTENLPTDVAYILYTSGSTGRPKGVVHTHRSALSFVDWCSGLIAPTAEDRFSSHAPFHFDLSIFDLYLPIKHGAAIVLIGETLGKQATRLAPFVSERKITVWYSTPSILRLLIDYGKLEAQCAPELRVVVFAGEVFPLRYLRRLQSIWPKPSYFNFYGPTETNVCTYFPVPTPVDDLGADALPIGFPCSEDRCRVVDDRGSDVAEGTAGELVVAGGSVMHGYWNLPERNAAAFLTDENGARWYRTGDVVREDAALGYLYLGRRDRMVKRRGYRVELGEIEAALYRHDSITEAAVVAAEDQESGVRIDAFVVWSGDEPPSLIALKRYSAKNLPAYMIPDRFAFLPRLPKTSTDKIDYQALARTE